MVVNIGTAISRPPHASALWRGQCLPQVRLRGTAKPSSGQGVYVCA